MTHKGDRLIRTLSVDDNVEPLIEAWKEECQSQEFGMVIKTAAVVKDILALITQSSLSTCLVIETEGGIVGLMGITTFVSPLGGQLIANEHYWYVLPEYRRSAIRLITAAEVWAKEHGCSHVMLNASALASKRHGRVTALYSALGYKPFEWSFLKEVA